MPEGTLLLAVITQTGQGISSVDKHKMFTQSSRLIAAPEKYYIVTGTSNE
uniref:Uncharacterized protein n=1 Tax=Arion vulgaris TaxID=1028688 RepID=A0A0B6YBA3_9EUPU